eukprot:2050852-Pyramimonas_sp.AAC.1
MKFSGAHLRDMGDHGLVGAAAAEALIGTPDLEAMKKADESKGDITHVVHEETCRSPTEWAAVGDPLPKQWCRSPSTSVAC